MTGDWLISLKVEQARHNHVMNRKTGEKGRKNTLTVSPLKRLSCFYPFHLTIFFPSLVQVSPTCRIHCVSRDYRNSDKCKLGHDFLGIFPSFSFPVRSLQYNCSYNRILVLMFSLEFGR